MSEEKKKRNKIIGISIGVLVVLLVVISSTYAYWQITKSQKDPNSIIAQCLSLEMENQTGTFGLEDIYPMDDSEGLSKTGFTFDVVNNCERDIAYVIGMDSVETDLTGLDGYIQDKYIKIAIDNIVRDVYGNLDAIDHLDADNLYTIRNSKEINTATVLGKVGDEPGRRTHNIKAWIDESAPLEENNKAFSGRVFITGGQFIDDDNSIPEATADACFEMSGGEIIGYDETCGTSVTIPASVNGTPVTTIDTNAFKEDVTIYNYDFVSVVNSEGTPIRGYVTDHDSYEETKEWAVANNFGSVELFLYEGTPTLNDGEMLLYCNMSDDINNMCVSPDGNELMYTEKRVSIKELDLSYAYNLELIEAIAFSNHKMEFDGDLGVTKSFLVQYEKQTTSLTSLKFGENQALKLGFGAFNGIDVDNLVVYSNMDAEYDISGDDSEMANSTLSSSDYIYGYFGGSTIDNLTIKYVEGYESLDDQLYAVVNSNNITIEEGITIIGIGEFQGSESPSIYGKNVTIPSSITTIGDMSFNKWPSTSIINVLKTQSDFEANVTVGNIGTWYGNATVKYLEG